MIFKNSARIRLCSLAIAALLSPGCSRTQEAAAPAGGTNSGPETRAMKVSLQLDWFPSPEHGGFFQALANNYYRDAGLDVSILPGGGGPDSLPLLSVGTGRTDLAIGRCDDVILAVKQGLPLVIVAAQMQHDPQAVMVHADSPVRSFRDLGGKSVMAGPAANWVVYVQEHFGVKFRIIPTDYGLARFMADKDFIQQVFISNEPFFAERGGVKTRTLLIASGGYDPYRVVFTNRNFARDHPEAVRAFVAASIRGYTEFLNGDNARARARIQAENNSQTQDVMDYSIAAMRRYRLVEGDPDKGERVGLLTPGRMNSLLQTLVELKVIEAPLPLGSFVRFDFLPHGPEGAAK